MSNISNVQQNIPLAPYTTFKIGGPAKFFAVVKNEGEIIESLKWTKENKQPYFILGHGANILVSDKGFDGLVIKNEMRRLEIRDEEVTADSGVVLSELIGKCASMGLSGLEFLAGVPSTLGGAIFGNAGAPEKAIGNFVVSARILDKGFKVKVLSKSECGFGYRQSVFQSNELIVLSAALKMEKGNTEKIIESIKNLMLKKKETQDLENPSAGCVFKNADGYSAGQLIDELGLKGKKIGQAQVSEKHANYIINLGGATADHVVQLISFIKQQVRDKKGVQLQEEIKYIGF
ncbi:MAG: UDP-N-acetylmuramate dehydrogenase [Patescibacteria group bacterium]